MSPEIADPAQELYKAVKDSYVRPEKIRYLLKKGANVNETRGGSTTILMTAVENILNSKVINELLQAGADVNAVNQYGQNVLMRAAAHNTNPEIIRMLIDSGADINSLDMHGNTVLMMASSKNNNPLVIMELIRAGADINAVNKFGDTALIMSVETYFSFDEYRDKDCSLEIIKILVRSGADTEIKGQVGTLTPLTEACEASHNPDVIETLITAGAKHLDSALDAAMNWDNCEAARVLLLYGADVVYSSYESEYGKTALDAAVKYKVRKILRELM